MLKDLIWFKIFVNIVDFSFVIFWAKTVVTPSIYKLLMYINPTRTTDKRHWFIKILSNDHILGASAIINANVIK